MFGYPPQRILQVVAVAVMMFLIGRWSMPTGPTPAERMRAAQAQQQASLPPPPPQTPAVSAADLAETRRALSEAEKSLAALSKTFAAFKTSTDERVATLNAKLKLHASAESKPASGSSKSGGASQPPSGGTSPSPTPVSKKQLATAIAARSASIRCRDWEAEENCPMHELPGPNWHGKAPMAPLPPKNPTPRPYDPASAGGYRLEPLPALRECLPRPVCVKWPEDGHPRGTPADPKVPPELCRSRYNTAFWRDDGEAYNWFWGAENGDGVGFYRWEVTTLETFHRFINGDTIHLDFGAWIGPTALFAAAHALRVYALEPDITALAALRRNVQINAALAPKIVVSNECISSRREELEMAGGGQSDSMLAFKDVPAPKWAPFAEKIVWADKSLEVKRSKWTVQCDTLMAFFQKHNLRPGEHRYFFKMDTESAESMIVPSLYEWLRNWEGMAEETTAARLAAGKEIFGKPTLLISMHTKKAESGDQRAGVWPWWDGDPHGHAFLKTLLLYRSVSDQSSVARWKRDVNPITIADIQECLKPCPTCYWGCDLLVTDIDY